MENQNENGWERPLIELAEKINTVAKNLINIASNTTTGQPPTTTTPLAKPKEPTQLEITKLIEQGTRDELIKQGINPDEVKSTVEIIERPVYTPQQKESFGNSIAAQIQEGTEKFKADRRDRAIQKLLGENVDNQFLNTASPI